MIGHRAGAVDDDVLAPAVEDVAVRVGEGDVDVDLEFLRPRLIAKNARVFVAHRRAVDVLHLRLVERPFLEIRAPPGSSVKLLAV